MLRWLVVLGLVCVVLQGCTGNENTALPSTVPSPNPPPLQQSILGMWKFISAEENGQSLPSEPNVIITYDFQADGTVNLKRLTTTAPLDDPNQGEQALSTYQFVSDDEIKLTIEGDTRQLRVTIVGNILTLSAENQEFNGKATFERVIN